MSSISIFEQPLVTVVVPYYKHKIFVEKCLDSIAAQTYEEIEVIVIDDCSPDGSGEFVKQLCQDKSLQKRFASRLRFEGFKKNGGAHNAINYGISQAQGQVIGIINSDDMYHPQRFELMIREMKRQQTEFAFSRVRYIDEFDQDVTESHDTARNFRMLQERSHDFPTIGYGCLAFNFGISTGNYVFTKSLYNRVGKFRSYLYCHDWDFLLRAIMHVEPAYLEEDLYYYRFHGKNSFESLQHIGMQECSDILRRYFDAVQCRKTLNPIAPSPANWPGYFELFLKLRDYSGLYEASVNMEYI